MRRNRKFLRALGWVALAALSSDEGRAQVTVAGREVQFHGFFSQGFLRSSGNNYLTTSSLDGSYHLTDGGLNASTQVTNRFRIGAQAYVRNVGKLGKGHVTLDWAFGDYRVNDWLGVRVGQVKTVLGLYNDTQDLEFLHTWALLPQSLYPIDLRGYNISHLGGDLYGSIPVRGAGTVSYTVYGGKAPPDRAGGLQYGLASYDHRIGARNGSMYGADLKWSPLRGLLLGVGYLHTRHITKGDNQRFGGPFLSDAHVHDTRISFQYSRGPWRIEWEHSRGASISNVSTALSPYGPYFVAIPFDMRGSYAAAAFRVRKWLELGTYHSRFYPNANRQVPVYGRYAPPAERHVYDQAVTGRFDFKTHFDLKIEGHFIDGYGDPGTARGFYPQDNPQGMQPRTNLLVVRLGFNR